MADLAIALDYPLVIVARRGLGTLNHTLLTVEAARIRRCGSRASCSTVPSRRPTPLAEATNAEELARPARRGIAVLAELPPSIGWPPMADWSCGGGIDLRLSKGHAPCVCCSPTIPVQVTEKLIP